MQRARDRVWWSGTDGPNGVLLEAVLHEVDSFLHHLASTPVPAESLRPQPVRYPP